MLWVLLVFLGVPLWLCAVGITVLVLRNRSMRKRDEDIPLLLRHAASTRWHRGHGIWIHDVFAFRASPAAWSVELLWVQHAASRKPTGEELHRLRHLGHSPTILTLTTDDSAKVEIATAGADAASALGPFAATP